jgi:two-component system, NarL family, nitrate/nitrite response regulator NarL
MQDIQVLIVDAHQLARAGLRLLLAGEAYEVVCATTSLETALPEIEGGLRPHLLVSVLDGSGDTFQNATLQRIRSIVPECRVVLIASNISSALLARALDWGVNALLPRDMSMEVLVRSLHLVMLGQNIFPTSASAPPCDPSDSALPAMKIAALQSIRRLSDRERHVLHYLLAGHSNKMIARQLNVSEATVKVHMKSLLRKLNVRNRTQAAMWGVANGFSDRDSSSSPPSAHSQPVTTAERAAVELVA